MTTRLVRRTKPSCTCIADLYLDYAQFLEMPEQLAYGGEGDCNDCHNCTGCNPWKSTTRKAITNALRRAVRTLEKRRGIELCKKELTILVGEDECPIELKTPIDYLGKKVLVEENAYPVCYTYRTGCDPDYTECFDRIGQVVIDSVPDEWDGDVDLIEFDYPPGCDRTICFPNPCFDSDCCQAENSSRTPCPQDCNCIEKCVIVSCDAVDTADGYCSSYQVMYTGDCSFTVGQRVQIWQGFDFLLATITDDAVGVTFSFDSIVDFDCVFATHISDVHITATFEMYHLIKPSINSAHICAANCTEFNKDIDAFLDEVTVRFYKIDETQAFEIAEVCSCSTCEVCTCSSCRTSETEDPCVDDTPVFSDFYNYDLDYDTGELCLTRTYSACSCLEPHRIKITYGVDPIMEEDVSLAIILRALLWSNRHIRCGCDDYDKIIEYWLDEEVGTQNEALATRKSYPYGRTRAGVELLRLLEDDEVEQQRDRRIDFKSGLFTATKANQRFSSKSFPRRKYINPRSNF